jgi:hypothetical protein
MSTTLPDVSAGPTIRKDNEETVPASKGNLGFSIVFVFFCAKTKLDNSNTIKVILIKKGL